MSSSPESKPSKRKIGPFTIEGKLGVGGMGIVYDAIYEKDNLRYALKVLSTGVCQNPQVVARFEREMAILKRMRHPHIVRYFGGGKSGGQRFFAMEYMPGGSLEHVVRKKGKLPWEEALEILIDVAKALEFAHSQGVIHRDLKPANLFICENGHIKLGDFGIARDSDATALTAAGKTVGTYAYMAPEQIAGSPPISKQTDLYALGCVAFELLTGRPPFVTDEPAQMLFGHLNQTPPHVREYSIDCPLWLDEVVDRLLAKKPEDRYFDALAVQVALEEVKTKVREQESYVRQTVQGGTTASGTLEGKQIRNLVQGKKKKKKKKSIPIYEQAWFLGLCLVLMLGGIAWAMWPASEAELYASAQELMESEEESDWIKARDYYLKPLLEKYPDGEHAKQAQLWLDQVEMNSLERQIRTRLNLRKDGRNEPEQLLLEALKLENEKNRLAAIARYRSVYKLLRTRPNARLHALLAEKHALQLESEIGANERLQFVQESLRKAESDMQQGRIGDARATWNGMMELYGAVPELAYYVDHAQRRINGDREPPTVDLGQPESESPSSAEE